MFRTFARKFLPNKLDWILWRAARKKKRRILLAWNRGLGDIALGLYAIVQRIRAFIPDAEITFLTRENLKAGFSMLEGVHTLTASDWKRGEDGVIDEKWQKEFDLVIEKPNPTHWVSWQHGKITPRLKWDVAHNDLYQKFDLPEHRLYVGVQVLAETNYGLWRNLPLKKWEELFTRLEEMGIYVILFGYGSKPTFTHRNIIDLRGKTTLFELLSLIQKKLFALILPDSGIASFTYYLDVSFPIRLLTLWADPNHGILKQNVASPNPQLIHCPLIAAHRDLSTLSVERIIDALIPNRNVGAILLAGGQGTRLGHKGPKGLFSIEGKTLFEWICEKAPKNRPIAIMTSPLNHEETVSYFEKKNYFGLDVSFFQQEMGPLLDENKKPIEKQGPVGNGNVFRSFIRSGLAELFAQKGVELVTVTNVDNPLGRLFDSALIASLQGDVTVQCIERGPNDRLMGSLVQKGDSFEIIEYTELVHSQSKYVYTGQLAFHFPFFCKMGTIDLPLHWVQKTVEGNVVWKGEQFIFDVLPYAKWVQPLCVQRETHYAPIKGPESIETAQNLLRKRT